MKVLVISGSRNPEGQTAKAAGAYVKGVIGGGGECEMVFLPTIDIQRCRQCNENGWGICLKEGKCIISDDFAEIVDKIRSCDAIVFATPVYYSDLSESLRAFLDRLRRTCTFENRKSGIAGKPAIGICVAGGSGGGAPRCGTNLDLILSTCGMSVEDMYLVRRQNLTSKIEQLESAGKRLINNQASAEI
jgi:multimeric flavodoxin WrbA